ncbi:hypothetical protein ACFVH4_19005 [Nocardia ignorata]|uniref:hypothetical protein n=1 Tax=Nocardia ignorata TaxID=145285 RepID=UPI00362EB9AF
MNLPDWLDRLQVAIVQRVIAPRIDCTHVRPGQLEQMRNSDGHPSPTLRAAIQRAAARRR